MTSGLRRLAALTAPMALAACIPVHPPPEPYGRPREPRAEASAEPDIPSGGVLPATPQPAPAWVARAVVPDARTVAAGTHVVKRGETLRGLGAALGTGAEALAGANGLAAGAPLIAGRRLVVPGRRYHLVRAGDSGVAIARAYGVPWSTVVALNDLQPPYLLRAGRRLLLPPAAEVARMSVEQRAEAFQLDIDDLVTGSEPAVARNTAPAKPTTSRGKPVPPTRAVAEPSRFAGRFDWPLTGRIIARFGPADGGRRNDGINIAADEGDPIRAAADGVVAYAGSAIAVYGGLVLVKHGDGWITAYGHAEKILVARGQAVRRGDVIARAGATGSANRPQLHFEIRKGRAPVDPIRYLPDRD